GPRNPAVQLTPTLNRRHRADDNWAGMSSMMSERSTLDHVIANESFVTFFNLGNGFFFNWRGERQNNLEWHNIGVQDYMPTWRFWFAPEFAQKNVAAGTTKLDAGFVWSDAYMGGSCLKVSGSADKEYLHLFRTAIIPSANNKIVIRYKLLNGEANINLVTSTGKIADGKSALDPGAIKGVVLTVAESADVCDQSYAEGSDGWVTKVFNVSTANARNYTAANGGVGVIALEFTNAKNMELLLGEFGWYPGASGTSVDNITKRTTPQAPVLAKATPLTYANTGADVKMIWNMNHNKAAGEPVYNSDVNTSVFRMYAQQEGFEPVNMGMTTSWAGICYQIPVDGSASSTRVRVGVSAVSEDYLTESPITWSDYMTLPSYQGSDAFVLNKTILKTNEKFTISFVDPLHVSADWKIINSETNTDVWTGSGAEVTCPGLPKVGLYNLEVSFGSTLLTYRNYISVSPDASGAIPEIYTLALNGTDVEEGPEEVTIEVNEPRTFSYTGRDSDGYASQGIEFQSNWVGVNVGELGIQANSSFSVAGWVYYPAFNGSISNFITIEDRTAIWPQSNWGFLWTRINKEGKFLADKIDSAWGCRCDSNADGVRIYYRYDDAQIPEAAWTHVALVFEYNENGEFRQKFYINGVLQKVSIWMKVNKMSVENVVGGSDGRWTALEEVTHLATNWGEDTYEPDYLSSSRPLSSSDWIAFGGRAHEISALEGYIDDFQVWGKAMTQEDVLNSMSGLDASNLPAAVLGFWDFEAAPDADDAFVGKAGANASNAAPKAYHWYQIDDPDHEGRGTKVFDRSASHAGSPQLSGSYKIETLPTWNAGRGATVTGTGTGATGTADIQWAKPGDYAVELTLSNDHGSDTRTYPVVKVEDPSAAIGGVETDADGVVTYVESNTVFVEFAADGDYTVEVYNVAGVMVGHKDVNATAGQNAQITLSNTGIYLVKVVSGGKVMRTVKVLVK
ncbi:MAG: T9SS type A sorting domain-containing protein, partial [Paramuribaculum sp.]|nr:T9SS type A sorting domain-containing protein [Paramuribaculum sp.]